MNTCLRCHKRRETSDTYCETCKRRMLGQTKTFELTEHTKVNNSVVFNRGKVSGVQTYCKTHPKRKNVRQFSYNVWTIH